MSSPGKPRETKMATNIYVLPETYGPGLRDYYAHLLQQPLPQQLNDMLAMLDEAAQGGLGTPNDAKSDDQAAAPLPERQSDKSE